MWELGVCVRCCGNVRGCSSLASFESCLPQFRCNETAVEAMLAGVGVYFIPNPSLPSNLSAAMRRNSRDTMPNTLESIRTWMDSRCDPEDPNL